MTNGQYFVFLNPNSLMVSNNINRLGHDRLTSASCLAMSCFDTSPAPYDDGPAQYAVMIQDAAGSWIMNPNLYTSSPTPYQSKILSPDGGPHPYRQELEGEAIRRNEFALQPSRLSSLFAFDSMEACALVAKRYKWNLSEVRSARIAQCERTRVLRTSMDLVSMLLNPNDPTGDELRAGLWRQYWRGESIEAVDIPIPAAMELAKQWLADGEIWEYLIEGQLILDPVAPAH
jgi:hypothetical protein